MKKIAPEHKTLMVTVWSLENKHGEKFDVLRSHLTGHWIIDKLFYDGEDWDGNQVYRGLSTSPVSALMEECGVESLLF